MKLQAILLGEVSGSPLCAYQYNESTYFCMEELDTLERKKSILTLLDPSHPILVSGKRTFLSSQNVAHMARHLNNLALAELCQLNQCEMMAGVVSAPLLTSLGVVAAVPARLIQHPITVSHVTDFQSWLASKQPIQHSNSHCRDLHREEERLSSFMQKLSHHPLWQGVANGKPANDMWTRFASWFGDYHKQLPPSLLATFKTRRQQQAIIASRQRRHAMEPSSKAIKRRRSNNNTALRQDDNTSSSSSCSSRGNSPQQRLGSPLRHEVRSVKRWTSPPIRTCRSVTELHRPVPYKATLQLPPPWTTKPDFGPRKFSSLQELRHRGSLDSTSSSSSTSSSGESNLDLLATQATQRQPISSSPSAIKLPSPSEMLARRPPSGIV
ncbi:hypothetical protein BJV82DRAFT_637107 [Fennellomyces sp. T-0311]|nr:hypothetical protein BJV82DRAFT_637107 [Fennellomyces sp. T-0311]